MQVSLNRMLWAEHNNRSDLLKSIRDEIIDSTPTNIYNFVENSVFTPVWRVARVSVYDIIQGNLYTFAKKLNNLYTL